MIRNLEIIGEAVKQLPPELTARHPGIPWKDVAGMRDQLIHHYFGVNLKLVCGVVVNRLEALQAAVSQEFKLLL